MDWYNIDEISQQTVLFPHKIAQQLKATTQIEENGGIINNGKWSWLAQETQLQVVSLENGQNICMFDFAKLQGYEAYEISYIEQVFARNQNRHDVLLAIVLQSKTEPKSIVVIYSVEESDIILSLQLSVLVTAAHFVPAAVLGVDLLDYFDGCLAVGNSEGCMYLLNLDLGKALKQASRKVSECQIIDVTHNSHKAKNVLESCIRDEKYFALQLTTQSGEPKAVTCILAVEIVQGLVMGFSDGSLALFDLSLLYTIHTLNATYERRNVPIVKLCYLLPLDDPTPCFYLWAVYKSPQKMLAVMHTLAYHNYKVDKNRGSLRDLRKMHVCLEVELESEACSVLGFQTISSISALNEEDGSSLCMISWYNMAKTVNKIVLFDLNQWYKEEMPKFVNGRRNARFLAGFVLNTQEKGVSAYLDSKTISHFNSLHREEEHFYPNALSFNVKLLQKSGCRTFNWDGLQNRVIHKFRSSNASIFLETEKYYNEILAANLLPQFNDLNGNANKSVSPLLKKYETMLSFALEYNCCSLIRDCVNCWSDGSFSGNLGIKTGLSLSVIVNWLCKRSDCIENRCKYLCKGLLESSGGYALDQREQKELSMLIRQLKLLMDVAVEVNNKCKVHNNELLGKSLAKKLKLLQSSVFFYPIVLWLFNIGILPVSALPYAADFTGNFQQLERFFSERRAYLKECLPVKKPSQGKSKSTHLLFIDAYIQHAGRNDEVASHWQAAGGNSCYPPPTICAMLDVLMMTDLQLESKTIMLLYFFLDLHATLEHVPTCKAVLAQLVKFPTVFQINANLIKLVQTFWFIDHGNFAQANIDEFLTIIKQNHNKEWLLDLLLQILVAQNESELALRVFQAAPTLISPALKLKTLLANDLITEAFQIARCERILEVFFEYCITKGKYSIIRDLALNEAEGGILLRLLKNCKEYCAENLQFVYLLSRSKYIEAVAYMDELSKKKGLPSKQKGVIENSNLVLSAFNTTMAPMAQGLTDIYFRIHNKLKHKELENSAPVPLSCQLIKQNANTLLGGMYHSSVLSAHFATQYLKEMNKEMLYSDNVPFLRKPQLESYPVDPERQYKVCMPQTYKGNIKRGLEQDRSLDIVENPQKRRKVGLQIIEDLSLKHGKSAVDLAEEKKKLNESFKKIEDTQSQLKSSIKTVDDMPKVTKNVNFIEKPEETKYWTTLRNMPTDYTSETLNKQIEKNVVTEVISQKQLTTTTTTTTTIDSVLEEEEVEGEEKEMEMEMEVQVTPLLVKKSITTTTTIDDKALEENLRKDVEKEEEVSQEVQSKMPAQWQLQARKPLSHVSLESGDSGLYSSALTSVLTTMPTIDFGPKVCSTTVADAEQRKSEIIYSECTTVIDDTETATSMSLYLKSTTKEVVEESQFENKLHVLETTLDWEDNSMSREAERTMSEMEFYNTASEIEVSQLNESAENKVEEEVQKRPPTADEIISLDDDDDDDDIQIIETKREEENLNQIPPATAGEIISLEDDDSNDLVSSSDCDDEQHNLVDTSSDEDECVEDDEGDVEDELDVEEQNTSGDTDIMIDIEDNSSALDTSNEQNISCDTESKSENANDIDMDELIHMPIANNVNEDQTMETENPATECKIMISNIISLSNNEGAVAEFNTEVENKEATEEILAKQSELEIQEEIVLVSTTDVSPTKSESKQENEKINPSSVTEIESKSVSNQEEIVPKQSEQEKYISSEEIESSTAATSSNDSENISIESKQENATDDTENQNKSIAEESVSEKNTSSSEENDSSINVTSSTENENISVESKQDNEKKDRETDSQSNEEIPKKQSDIEKNNSTTEVEVSPTVSEKSDLESTQDKDKNNTKIENKSNEKSSEKIEVQSHSSTNLIEADISLNSVEAQNSSLSVSNAATNELNESSDISLQISTPESVEKTTTRKTKIVPKQSVKSVEESLARRRQSKRGISVPPQVVVENKSNLADNAYTANRQYRATSLQPREYADSPTPLKRTKSNRSIIAYLNDYSPNLDSPSQNTRSRRRLLSEDNESDISMVSDAQTNYSSKSRPKSRASTVMDERSLTPKGRKRRGASVVPEDNETNDVKDDETANKKSKEDTLQQRRLTRHQLAILEKANAQTAAYAASQKTDDTESLKSTSSKRLTRSSLKNMNKNQLEDDAMSVSSLASSTNSKRRTRGRTTPKNLTTIPENN